MDNRTSGLRRVAARLRARGQWLGGPAAVLAVVAAVVAAACAERAAAPAESPSPPPASATPSPSPEPAPLPTATPDPPSLTLLAVGDMMFDRSIGYRIREFGPDAIFDSEMVALLAAADITVGNLECAISERGEPQPKGYTFRAPPAAAETLELAGFDLVSIANNHALDYGPLALADTSAELTAHGILTAGGGPDITEAMASRTVQRDGMRIAFVALLDVPAEGEGFSRATWEAGADSPGLAWADTASVTAAVEAAARSADAVVVMLHFGYEYELNPNSDQRALARAAIDAGAVLVIGSHPHVLQEVEEYNGGLIAYSLGNFVFDGFEGESNATAILQVTLTRDGVTAWDLIPAEIIDGLPVLAP